MGYMEYTLPENCPGCGEKIANMFDEENPMLLLNIGIPGVALFPCSKCFTVMANRNCYENVKKIQEEGQKLIQVPKPNLNSPMKVVGDYKGPIK